MNILMEFLYKLLHYFLSSKDNCTQAATNTKKPSLLFYWLMICLCTSGYSLMALGEPIEPTIPGGQLQEKCQDTQFASTCPSIPALPARELNPLSDELPFKPQIEPALAAHIIHARQLYPLQSPDHSLYNDPTLTIDIPRDNAPAAATSYSCDQLRRVITTTFLWDLEFLENPYPLSQIQIEGTLESYLGRLDPLNIFLTRKDYQHIKTLFVGDQFNEDLLARGSCKALHDVHQYVNHVMAERDEMIHQRIKMIASVSGTALGVEALNLVNDGHQPQQGTPELQYVDRELFSLGLPTEEELIQHIDDRATWLLKAALTDIILFYDVPYTAQLDHLPGLPHHIQGAFQDFLSAIRSDLSAQVDLSKLDVPMSRLIKFVTEALVTNISPSGAYWQSLSPHAVFAEAFLSHHEETQLLCEDIYNGLHRSLQMDINYKTPPIGSPFYLLYFDEELSGDIIDNFLTDLDSHGVFFTQEDRMTLLDKHAPYLASYINHRQCQPLLEIATLLKKRVRERMEILISTLKGHFDFSIDESIPSWIRSDDFPQSHELNDRVRKVVKYSYLRLRDGLSYFEDLPALTSGRHKLPQLDLQMMIKLFNDRKAATEKLTATEVYSTFLNAVLSVRDKYSGFFFDQKAWQLTKDYSIGAHAGVGVTVAPGYGDYVVIEAIIKGGPAEASGQLQPGDRILEARNIDGDDQWHPIPFFMGRASGVLRGPSGSNVLLRIQRPIQKPIQKRNQKPIIQANGQDQSTQFEEFVVSLTRAPIPSRSAIATSHLFEVLHSDLTPTGTSSQTSTGDSVKVGWVKLDHFSLNDTGPNSTNVRTGEEVQALRDRGAEVIVIDLRDNGGGGFQTAVNTVNLFVRPEVIMSTIEIALAYTDPKTRASVSRVQKISPINPTALSHNHLAIPLITLVSRVSASASEAFAGSMIAHGRGVVVGEDFTYGKASMQGHSQNSLSPLLWRNPIIAPYYPDLAQLSRRILPPKKPSSISKVTRGYYMIADGTSPQKYGVDADINLPSIRALLGATTQRYQMSTPEPPSSLEDQSLNLGFRPNEILNQLQRRSGIRTANNPVLKAIEQIARQKTMSSSTSDSIIPRYSLRRTRRERSITAPSAAELSDDPAVLGTDEFNVHELLSRLSRLYTNLRQIGASSEDLSETIVQIDPHLNEALLIAADYFMLCRKPHEMSSSHTAQDLNTTFTSNVPQNMVHDRQNGCD